VIVALYFPSSFSIFFVLCFLLLLFCFCFVLFAIHVVVVVLIDDTFHTKSSNVVMCAFNSGLHFLSCTVYICNAMMWVVLCVCVRAREGKRYLRWFLIRCLGKLYNPDLLVEEMLLLLLLLLLSSLVLSLWWYGSVLFYKHALFLLGCAVRCGAVPIYRYRYNLRGKIGIALYPQHRRTVRDTARRSSYATSS